MKNLKKSLTKTSSILLLGVFTVIAISGSAFADIAKGTGQENAGKSCVFVKANGRTKTGPCQSVCKDKTVYTGGTIHYGTNLYCKASVRWSTSPLISTTPSDTLSRPVYKPTPKPSKHFYNNYKRNWTFTR